MAATDITLPKTVEDDLDMLFQFQLDKEAGYLAAFTSKDPNDKAAYIEKFTKYIADPGINMRTIKIKDEIVGSIAKFFIGKDVEITYWIDRKCWGRGIATTALKQLLEMEQAKPVFARVAFDNYGSQRVLEKCGFIKTGKDNGFSHARQAEIEEYIYKLAD